MFNQHGSAGPLWDAAKAEVRAVLIEVARKKERVSYSELAAKVRSMNFDPLDTRLVHLLGQIGRDEAKAGRGLLSAVVVDQTGDTRPGQGFVDLAKSLGRDTADEAACWMKECDAVHAHWSKPGQPR